MTRINAMVPRTTALQQSDSLLSAIQRTQRDMLKTQNEISTGLSVTRPSDAPAKTSAILLLQSSLDVREQYLKNLSFAQGMLDTTDQSLADVSNLLLEAKNIGSSQIGIGSNTDTRKNQATVLDGQIQALVNIANRQFQGVSLFGGNVTPGEGSANKSVFVFRDDLGGVRYLGAAQSLNADLGLDLPLAINSNGSEAFSAVSARVEGDVDLGPVATNGTKLSDLTGANGFGIRKGSIIVTVNGTDVGVDLTTADTMGDVVTRINDAITSVNAGAGSLALSGNGFTLTANGGFTIAIDDSATGNTASDLGITISATAAVAAGDDVNPKLTSGTLLTSLNGSIDWTSGLKVTQGSITKTADFSSATTVQDLMNVVSGLGLGLRLEVNADGTGLNMVSEISGPAFSIGEVSGGTTATDLGLRSFNLSTRLSDLNFGLGVSNVVGANDFAFTLHDGTSFNVDIDGAATVGDVIDRIRTAAETALGAANVGFPGDAGKLFNVGLALDGNGMSFEDATVGGGNFAVSQVGISLAATDLGIYKNAGTGGTLTGDDVAQVRTESVFTHLIALRDALLQDDSRGITLATSALETDVNNTSRVHADVGVRAKQVLDAQSRQEQMKLTEKSVLSDLRDADPTEAIMRFTKLQQQFEAALRVGAQNLQLSLLNFLG